MIFKTSACFCSRFIYRGRILTLTGLGIGFITGVLALLAGIFILIGR
jgi:hypothetical protein